MKFGGDSKLPGFFLAQVWNYMQEYGGDMGSEASKVRCVAMALKGATAEWMVSLHNDNASQLQNYNQFIAALCSWFKDPLAERKARTQMKTITQVSSRLYPGVP